MSLRYKEETNVYDEFSNILGQIDGTDFLLIAAKDAKFTIEELREIAEYLETL